MVETAAIGNLDFPTRINTVRPWLPMNVPGIGFAGPFFLILKYNIGSACPREPVPRSVPYFALLLASAIDTFFSRKWIKLSARPRRPDANGSSTTRRLFRDARFSRSWLQTSDALRLYSLVIARFISVFAFAPTLFNAALDAFACRSSRMVFRLCLISKMPVMSMLICISEIRRVQRGSC
jgi:hypothetical protein